MSFVFRFIIRISGNADEPNNPKWYADHKAVAVGLRVSHVRKYMVPHQDLIYWILIHVGHPEI